MTKSNEYPFWLGILMAFITLIACRMIFADQNCSWCIETLEYTECDRRVLTDKEIADIVRAHSLNQLRMDCKPIKKHDVDERLKKIRKTTVKPSQNNRGN